MSGAVDANPDDLERFSRQLQASRSAIEQELKQLQSGFDKVHWRDKERQRFETELSVALRALRSSLNQLDPLMPELRKKAQQLRTFLNS